MNNIMEYVKCRDDIFYFMEKYLNLQLRGYQIDQLNQYLEVQTGQTLNILGHRECGITLINCVFLLWKGLFGTNEKAVVISPSQLMSNYNSKKIMELYAIFCSNWNNNQTRYEMSYHNSTTLINFTNSCIIKFLNYTNMHQVRGISYNYMFFDDVYYSKLDIDDISVVKSSAKKYIITNSCLPEHVHPLEDTGVIIKYPWYCDCKRTQQWQLSELNSLGKPAFNLMYGCTRGLEDGK
ncbi:terminase DNA packaging enzyme large subunit [Serratia phage BF]|uniref:Terminase DNA packaging enzyme large subunit n=1 Tax=Serratia phage BF TaxID=1962671 RepID=A0A1S6UAT0_9CAUD|nr:terminase DNA packaging enzyme large subunit [Serratia phage BF]AQW88797.1 terminase DNA packaging enzyme large subunit [Serratia phage BF]